MDALIAVAARDLGWPARALDVDDRVQLRRRQERKNRPPARRDYLPGK
jgi:hypothetical protein